MWQSSERRAAHVCIDVIQSPLPHGNDVHCQFFFPFTVHKKQQQRLFSLHSLKWKHNAEITDYWILITCQLVTRRYWKKHKLCHTDKNMQIDYFTSKYSMTCNISTPARMQPIHPDHKDTECVHTCVFGVFYIVYASNSNAVQIKH